MRSWPVILLLIVSSVAPLASGADGDDGDDPDLANVPKGGTSWFPPGGVESSAGAFAASTLWLLAWTALAGVIGLVVVSSLTKPRPVPGDPLVTAPGVALAVPRAGRARGPFVAVPQEAAFESGRDLAFRASPATVEHALGLMRALGLGDATLVPDRLGERIVRVQNCSSCQTVRPERRRRGAPPEGVPGCAFERGFLAGAFEAVLGREAEVDEVRCAGKPGGACEFRVRA